jgi:hypothetical protein
MSAQQKSKANEKAVNSSSRALPQPSYSLPMQGWIAYNNMPWNTRLR